MEADKINISEDEIKMKNLPPNKIPYPIIDRLKKLGFTVWLSVMIIGGVLAFLTALVLL